ncbi:MAG: hypothetical protein IJ571_06005 [Ruminococcus sp.]|nr:hypothetical protein [Ruminococcus sp.]
MVLKGLIYTSAACIMTSFMTGCGTAVSSSYERSTTTAATTTTTEHTSIAETTATETSVETTTTESSSLTHETTEKDILDNSLGLLSSKEDIDLRDIDGNGKNYEFDYNSEVYSAIYTPDNWKIVDSYKITNSADMKIICQALIDENPLHGKDMVSYREARDMVEEWLQHNLAYHIFYDNTALRARAKDVDLNPEDQGRNIIEKYRDIAKML